MIQASILFAKQLGGFKAGRIQGREDSRQGGFKAGRIQGREDSGLSNHSLIDKRLGRFLSKKL
jgi:hypothetical protein